MTIGWYLGHKRIIRQPMLSFTTSRTILDANIGRIRFKMNGVLFKITTCRAVKGCGMSPLLVLVSPCFRANVVVTGKIGYFLCSLDTLLQKNVIVFFFFLFFFFGNQIPKWRSFEKRAIFGLLFTFFSHQGKVAKIPSARISLTYIHVFCSPYFLKSEFIRYGFSLVWFLVLILIRTILEQSINNKMVSKT